MANRFNLDAWCAAIPGLQKEEDGLWRAPAISEVSYSEGGHASLAEVEESSYWFNHRNAVISQLISRTLPNRATIFDIGGGNGYVSLGLARNGFETVVIEPGANGVSAARKRGLQVVQAAYQDLDVPDGSIPTAGLFDVLEHLEDDIGALRALHRAIEPGGMLYLAVPALSWLWSNEDIEAGHYRRYRKDDLAKRVESAGFEVQSAAYFFASLVLPVFLMRVVPYRLRIKGDRGNPVNDYTLPENAVGRLFERWLAKERAAIEATGEGPSFGTSIFLAARRSA